MASSIASQRARGCYLATWRTRHIPSIRDRESHSRSAPCALNQPCPSSATTANRGSQNVNLRREAALLDREKGGNRAAVRGDAPRPLKRQHRRKLPGAQDLLTDVSRESPTAAEELVEGDRSLDVEMEWVFRREAHSAKHLLCVLADRARCAPRDGLRERG